MKVKDRIREKLFSTELARSHAVTVAIDDDLEVEIRPPSIGRLREIAAKGEDTGLDALFDLIVDCCFVPGTGEPLFTLEDRESFMAMRMTEPVKKLISAVNEVANLDIQAQEKN